MNRSVLAAHRYLGLCLAGFLVISGITGSFLAFYAEFDALFNPSLYRIEQSGRQEAISAGQQIDAVEAFDPRVRVYYLPIITEPKRASVVYVEPIIDPATQQPFVIPFDEVFINPLTAEITGTRMWGECCGTESIIPIMHKLHNRLFLPTGTGRPLWGTVAILWSVMAVLGLLLTWPEPKPKLRRWATALKLRRGLPSLPRNINLHKATGLWFWLIILPIALSGVTLGLERQVFAPMVHVASTLFEGNHEQNTFASPTADDGSKTPVDTVIARAKSYAQDHGFDSHICGVWYDHEAGQYEIEFGLKNAAGLGDGSLFVSASSSEVTRNALAGSRSLETTAEAARERIHSGRVAGLPGRVLVFLCGWAVALLSITGVTIWFKRRANRFAK